MTERESLLSSNQSLNPPKTTENILYSSPERNNDEHVGTASCELGDILDFPDISLDDDYYCSESEASDRERLLGNHDNNREPNIIDRSKPVVIKRRVGLIHAVSLIFGGIVGSGIFISPTLVLKNSGSVGLTLIVWTLGGFFSLLGALCYCELGTMIEKSGGDFIYLKIAYGKMASFLYSWLNVWFIDPASFAIKSMTFSLYLSAVFNLDCAGNTLLFKLLAAISIIFSSGLNCASVLWSARAQVLFTGVKFAGIIIIICVGFLTITAGHTENFQNSFTHSNTDIGLLGHAFYSVMWSYEGWNCLNYITEEIKEPTKNFPRCMYISIPLVTICYVLINLTYFSILSPSEMLSSDAVAFTFAHKLSPIFGIIMPLLVAISCFGSINGQLFSGSRVLFSIAREKQMPKCLSFVNRHSQTPIPAIVLRTILGLVMLIPTSIEPLINCLLFAEWIYFFAMFVAVVLLRWKKPHLPRPYKVPLIFPIIMIFISLYFIATPLIVNPIESAIGLSILLAGVPVCYIFLVKQYAPRIVQPLLAKITYASYILCNVVEPAIPKAFETH